jgi:hypothetical protein
LKTFDFAIGRYWEKPTPKGWTIDLLTDNRIAVPVVEPFHVVAQTSQNPLHDVTEQWLYGGMNYTQLSGNFLYHRTGSATQVNGVWQSDYVQEIDAELSTVHGIEPDSYDDDIYNFYLWVRFYNESMSYSLSPEKRLASSSGTAT